MIVSVDVGYRQVKAMQANNQIVFPSSVAVGKSFAVEAIGDMKDYKVSVQAKDEEKAKEYFVGNLAEREAAHSLISQNDRVKHLDASHDILILTAVRLLMAEQETAGGGHTLVLGLPVSYYKAQKDELIEKTRKLRGTVAVDGHGPAVVKFNEVYCFPQGSGALLTVKNLPENGTVCLMDLGMKTTDCVVARITDSQMVPIASLCTSVELGVKDFYDAVAGHYQNVTGSAPHLTRVLELIDRKGHAAYNRKAIDLSAQIELARQEIQGAIIDRAKNSLADVWSELDMVYTAGGGALVFNTLSDVIGAQQIADPVWANAKGFLKVGQSKAAI